METIIAVANLLAALWIIIGTLWLLYQGVVYVMVVLTEVGLPRDEKRFSVFAAVMIVLGEIAIVGAVGFFLYVRWLTTTN
jgi:hypothetical protein